MFDKIKKIINTLPKPIRNKYIITLILFILWILFIDDYNLITQNKIRNKVNKLKAQKEFYISEIKSDSIELLELKNNSNKQEKFAREKFLMKKDNEDIYIIRDEKD